MVPAGRGDGKVEEVDKRKKKKLKSLSLQKFLENLSRAQNKQFSYLLTLRRDF